MRKVIRNYFEPNKTKNCVPAGVTLDGVTLWVFDKNQIGAEKDGLLYRVGFIEQLSRLQSINLVEQITKLVDDTISIVKFDHAKTVITTGPAFFDFIGRLENWQDLRDITTERKNAEQARKQKDIQDAESTYQELLNGYGDDLVNGKEIAGEILFQLADKYGVKIPPAVKGWANKSLYSVGINSYRIHIGKTESKTICIYARAVADAITLAK